MSFIAQPYEQFVDDLLTALTGGVIREEHRFVVGEATYRLASPGIVPASLKVFGQRNEAFTMFEQGISYTYDAAEEAIVWKEKVPLPDDRSYFYVNYYLQEGRRRLTDRNPGSVTTTLAEAFAREFAVLHKQMEMIYRSAFVDLASGTALDHVVALLGLTRKDARFASGEVLFRRTTPAPGDITIAAGTLVSTDQGQNFETTDKKTLRKGQLAVAVPVRAQVEGPPGKVEAAAIRNINRPIFGVESVVQEEPTFFATEKETDAQLRQRMKGTLERAGKSTVNAIKFGLIEAVPEITEDNVQVSEQTVPGLVDVRLGLELPPNPEDLIRQVEAAIFASRPAGIRVKHNLPTQPQTPDTQGAEAAPSAAGPAGQPTTLSPQDVAGMPEGIFPLRAEVTLRLSDPNLSTTQKEQLREAVAAALVAYADALPMGHEVIYNKMLGRIVLREEVLDATLKIGAARSASLYENSLDTENRKAQLAFEDVTVQLMIEPVVIDVQITVKVKAEGSKDLTVPAQLKSDLEDAVRRVLAEAQTAVSKASLKTAFADTLAESTFTLVATDAVVLNAEYKETGRQLKNTDTVSLAEHQQPQKGQVEVELQTPLDAQN